MEMTGEYAAIACASPVVRLVAPGPFWPAKKIPGFPDDLA